MESTFYIEQTEKHVQDFEKKLDRMQNFIGSYFEDEPADELISDFVETFRALIPEIPYIGGKDNPLTTELVQSAWALAIYEVLQQRGKTLEEIGMFVYRLREALIASYPRFFLHLVGRYWFTCFFKNKRRKLAAETQKREYPDNFVINFVEGDGEAFDFGFDDIECGILKFYRKRGAEKLTPYLCASDIPLSRALNLGIQRTTTLALGGDRCDFRLKRGGETRCVATAYIYEQGGEEQSSGNLR